MTRLGQRLSPLRARHHYPSRSTAILVCLRGKMHTHTLTYNATRTSLESGHTIQLVHRCDITNLSQRWDLPAYRIHPDSQVSPRVDPRLRPCTSARRGRSEGASQRETRPDRRAARESSEHEIVRLCAYIWQDALQNTIVSDEYTTVQRRNTIASIGHAERRLVLRRTTSRFEDRDGPTEDNQSTATSATPTHGTSYQNC